jgi:hypothetical protein
VKTFFTAAALVTFVLGIAWLLFPATMLALWGASSDGMTMYVGRRCGALMLGYTAILWHSRAASASEARSAILAGGAIVTAMLAILSVVGALTIVAGPGAWIAAVIEALLTVGFLYFFVTAGGAPSAREEQATSAR